MGSRHKANVYMYMYDNNNDWSALYNFFFFQSDQGDIENAQLVFQNYLVEMSAIATSGQDAVGMEMKNMAEHLKSYPQTHTHTHTNIPPLPPSLSLSI